MEAQTVLPGAEAPLAVLDREPPHNYEVEAGLLGAVLANNQALEKVSDFLEPEHFAEPAHARIYDAVCRLIERGQVADSVQLAHVFNDDEGLKEVGGSAYLAELQSSIVSIINAADYGRTIFDLYKRRELIELADEVANGAYDCSPGTWADQQIEEAEGKLFKLAEQGDVGKQVKSFDKVLSQSLKNAEAALKRDGSMVGISTGLIDLDKLLGGLAPSDLIVLAGRPGMGKTALATNIAFSAARDGASVAFFSLEMSSDQLATRMMSERAEIPSEKIRRGEISNKDFSKVVAASRDMESLRYFIDDTPALAVSSLRARARRLKRQHGIDLIVVDYIQLMRGGTGRRSQENRVQEVTEITMGLKAVAKELNVPVIALSQLSRQVENREDKRPQLADLRESGSIEQDADIVMFAYRPEYYEGKAEPEQKSGESDFDFQSRYEAWRVRMDHCRGIAKVIVGKSRHGPTGEVELAFTGEFTRFSNITRRPSDA